MVFLGAVGALTFGEGDFVLVLYQLGLVGWGLVLLFGNLWKSNADTAYAFGVAGAELFDKPNKAPFVVAGSVLGTVLALTGVHTHLVDYLVLLGTFIPPLGGVIIGDWVMRWRGGIPESHTPPGLQWHAIVAYAVAAALAWTSGELGIGIPPVIGIVAAVVLVVVLGRVIPGTRTGAAAR
jgi:cytosine permease